ncbi:C2 calcium-dependent membrane targeting [Macleaya cordata]|uniref:C2 calcium-dependent membrane targeting n=1 Tax=Macleaya cordata TaxID=56857 RepID=A0A200QUS0_MACCD|nr:C2 calcium-dependent membrane targeting [Macleaya cordata]
MDPSQNPSSLNCELRIIRAKNLDFLTTGNLFVRYYLLNQNNQRIQLNTREIPLSSMIDPFWNELISLECSGAKNVTDKLSRQSVVFELRWRNTNSILGNIIGSKLLGRAEISWMEVLESKELSIEKWVTTISKNSRIFEGLKPAALQIGMKITVPGTVDTSKRRNKIIRSRNWNECGCKHGGCNDRDDDIFTLAAALEVF